MKKVSLNLLWSVLVTVVTSIGVSFTIKANIGTGSINALSGSLEFATGIKVGTVLMLINALCVVVQLVIQKKDFHWRQWLQILTAVIMGEVVNFMVYNIMVDWTVDNYILRVLLLIAGVTISCFGIGMIVRLNLIVFPVEAAATALAAVTKFNFRQVRQGIDATAISLALIVTILFQTPLTVREGTVINFFIFSHIAHFFITFVEKRKWFKTIRMD